MNKNIDKSESEHALQHFLMLAAAQLRSQIMRKEKNQIYGEEIAKLRLLEELVKEQISDGKKDPRSATGSSR